MFTVCPKCALTLVVTAADLRVAQGFVRCGRCANVFNALPRLSEERPAAQPEKAGEAPPAPAAGTGPQPPASPVAPALPPPPRGPQPVVPGTAAAPVAPRVPAQAAPPVRRSAPPLPAHTPRVRPLPLTPSPPAARPAVSKPAPAPAPAPALAPGPGPGAPAADADIAAPAPAADPVRPPGPPEAEPAVPDSALEFDPDSTDVNDVFIEPTPDPAWTAATGTFKALAAARADRAPIELAPPRPEPASAAPDAPARASPPAEAFEIELDALQLSTAPNEPEAARPAAPTPAVPPPPPAAADEPPAAKEPAHSAPVAPRARAVPAAVAKPTASSPVPPPPASGPDSGTEAPGPFAALLAPVTTPHPSAPLVDADPPREDSSAGQARGLPLDLDRPAVWQFAAGLLAVLLVAQVVHHYRRELAVDGRLGAVVTALYAAVGAPVVPHWNVRAYDVRQLGATVDAAASGRIVLRASIKNGAPRPQPLPLLRVLLEDRFGNPVAARDVEPDTYAHAMKGRLLAPAQRVDAELSFLDPGASAVGFELDACLPAPGGGLSCANDPG